MLGLILSPGWKGMKGMRRFMAASSTEAVWNIGNSFVVEKTVRDLGEEEGVCGCGKVRLEINGNRFSFLGK